MKSDDFVAVLLRIKVKKEKLVDRKVPPQLMEALKALETQGK